MAASKTALQNIRQLLVRREILYGGLAINVLFRHAALAVNFEAMPAASPQSIEYSPSAQIGFLTALKTLTSLAQGYFSVKLDILGIQRAATRAAWLLPPEAPDYFRKAKQAIDSERNREQGEKVASAWVVDLTRSTTDLESSRLERLLAEIERMRV